MEALLSITYATGSFVGVVIGSIQASLKIM